MYDLKWNSDHPGLVVFLLDLSGSMANDNKIDYVIDAVQYTLENLLVHCGQAKRLEVAVYGYNCGVKDLLGGICDVPTMIEKLNDADDKGSPIFDKENEAKPQYQTCMRMAFKKAIEIVNYWIANQKSTNIPAPIVINVTDGYPYEGENFDQEEVYEKTLNAAKELMAIRTDDGNVRLFNIHYEPKSNMATKRFPSVMPAERQLKFLYEASSPMTDKMVKTSKAFGFSEAHEGSRALISNEQDPSILANFLDWGSSQGVQPVPDAN